MTNKITVKDYFMELRALAERADRADLVAFVDTRIAQVEAKNSKRSDKPTKAQRENAVYADAIRATLEPGKAYTVSDILHAVDEVKDLSNQRVSAIVRAMVSAGSMTRAEVKGKAYFTLA